MGRPSFDAEETFQIVSEGRRSSGIMPPWGSSLTTEQLRELAAYLRWLSVHPCLMKQGLRLRGALAPWRRRRASPGESAVKDGD